MAAGRNFGLRWFRDARAQGRVGTAAIVMDHPLKKDVAEVAFGQRNEEVEALAPNGSNEPFAESICLRATNRCFQDADTEPGQFMIHARREDRIPVVNEKSVRMVAGQSLAELLERPLSGRMGGDIDVNETTGTDLHCDEDVQDSETGGDDGEKVTGDNRFRVIADERGPTLRGGVSWTTCAGKIFVNRAR